MKAAKDGLNEEQFILQLDGLPTNDSTFAPSPFLIKLLFPV